MTQALEYESIFCDQYHGRSSYAPHEYQHVHCSACDAICWALGGGGDDGRDVSGYENARRCSMCSDCYLCDQCVNASLPICPHCAAASGERVEIRDSENRVLAIHVSDPAPSSCDERACDECRSGAA